MGESRLAGKVAVVTGASHGLGRAIALRFLAEEAAVVAVDVDELGGRHLMDRAERCGAGDRALFTRGDVSVEDDVARAVALAVDELGGLDCVVNNAGIGGAYGPV